MKNLLYLLGILLSSATMISCIQKVGPAGPPGPEGPQGVAGENAYVFEYSGVYFESPTYDVVLEYPADFVGQESDVTLAYLLWEVTTDANGNNLEIWRQIPQTIVTQNGNINYNFDFTSVDFRVFLVPEFDPALLQPIDTDDWVVRAVVIPGNFWSRTTIDYSDYNAVKAAYGLPALDIEHKRTTRR